MLLFFPLVSRVLLSLFPPSPATLSFALSGFARAALSFFPPWSARAAFSFFSFSPGSRVLLSLFFTSSPGSRVLLSLFSPSLLLLSLFPSPMVRACCFLFFLYLPWFARAAFSFFHLLPWCSLFFPPSMRVVLFSSFPEVLFSSFFSALVSFGPPPVRGVLFDPIHVPLFPLPLPCLSLLFPSGTRAAFYSLPSPSGARVASSVFSPLPLVHCAAVVRALRVWCLLQPSSWVVHALPAPPQPSSWVFSFFAQRQ